MSDPAYITIEGDRLEVQRIEAAADRADAPTLVLLHEGLGCVSLWKDFPQRLNARCGFAVVSYSRSGYGRSSKAALPRPLDFHRREALQVLPRVLEALELADCILLGHSDGASIALIYAGLQRPCRAGGLVVLAPHVLTEAKTVGAIRQAISAYEQGPLRDSLARHHGDNVDCAFRGWSEAWTDPGFRHWSIEDSLTTIEVPVLCLRGADDPYNTGVHVERIEALVNPDLCQSIELSQCGHAPQVQCVEQTLDLISQFLAQHWPQRAK